MKKIQKTYSFAHELEQKLAAEIAEFSVHLSDIPEDRDMEALRKTWGQVSSTRRKYSIFLKQSLEDYSEAVPGRAGNLRQLRAMRKDLKRSLARIRLWARFESVVASQIEGEINDLIDLEIGPWREVEVMDHVISFFLDSMHKVANPTAHTQDDDANDLGCHRDIPLPMDQFARMIGAAFRLCLAQRKDFPLSFLDVGSGGGTKVLAATTCFDDCVGLEYEKSTVETGSAFLNLLAPDKCRLVQGDALAYEGYGDFDVIYFYRPLVSFEQMVVLEEQILSQAKPGTVLLVAGGLFTPDLESRDVHELAGRVYIVGVSKDEAQALKQTAMQMGKSVPGFGRRPYTDLYYWQPLYDACIHNGYFI